MEESRIKEMEEVWDSAKKMRGSRNWDDLVTALDTALETLDYRPASRGLRVGTRKQTNLGYANLVAENHLLNTYRAARGRATHEGSESGVGGDETESDMSAYEREREENIKGNLAVLEELGLLTAT